MSISAEEVKKVAYLARIRLSSAEVSKFQSQLREIILYNAHKLRQVNKKTYPVLPSGNNLGEEDQPSPSLLQEEALANASETKNGFVVVPKVLGDQ